MQRSRNEGVDVLIVLMSLVAEGTPQLALQLARQWQQDGLRVEVMVMQPEPLDLQAEFQSCLLYTSPSPRDRTRSRMPSSA